MMAFCRIHSLLKLSAFTMNLELQNLRVVSTGGSSFSVDTAYLVESSLVIGTTHAERSELAVSKGVKLADILNNDEMPFVSKHLMYEIEGCVYDENEPEYMFFVPCDSGRFWMVDCWIVNEDGSLHPGYNVAGVPIATKNLIAVDDSPRIMD